MKHLICWLSLGSMHCVIAFLCRSAICTTKIIMCPAILTMWIDEYAPDVLLISRLQVAQMRQKTLQERLGGRGLLKNQWRSNFHKTWPPKPWQGSTLHEVPNTGCFGSLICKHPRTQLLWYCCLESLGRCSCYDEECSGDGFGRYSSLSWRDYWSSALASTHSWPADCCWLKQPWLPRTANELLRPPKSNCHPISLQLVQAGL